MTDKIASAQRAAEAVLEQAEAHLADLMRAKIKASNHQRELTRVRQELAYTGLANGDPASRKRLIEATEEACRVEIELQNLGFGIVEGQRRVAEAQATVGREGLRVKAQAALGRAADMRKEGARFTALFSEMLSSYDAIVTAATEIKRQNISGARFPSMEQFELSVRTALQPALYRRHLNSQPMITAFANRKEIDAVLDNWISELEISLERLLDGTLVPADIEEAAE